MSPPARRIVRSPFAPSSLLLSLLYASFAFARLSTPPSAPPASVPSDPQVAAAFAQLPWPVKLGVRSFSVDQNFPLLDQVVLVPDSPTFLDEISRWSPRGRWPVLIEGDGFFASMFIRRFQPALVYRRPPLNVPQPPFTPDRAAIERAAIRAWAGNESQPLIAAFQNAGFIPPGVILASTADPAWPAALALSAGRGQPIIWIDGDLGHPDSELSAAAINSLRQTLALSLQATGYSWSSLGDDIDAVTFCRRIAGRARIQLPGMSASVTDPIAMTDVLGRNDDGARFALCAWIPGDEVQSAYIAMCSLFLQRSRVALLNGHPLDGGWEAYAPQRAADVLSSNGYTIAQSAQGDDMLLAPFQLRNSAGLSADLALINSKGNWDWFHLFKDQLGYAEDVPVLNAPCAIHLIHSWSITHPENEASIGGRFLRHGAYAFVGAMWEPQLGAFVPPKNLADRLVNFVPLLPASRMWEQQGQSSTAWRVSTLGDPLMLIAPPEKTRRTRIPADKTLPAQKPDVPSLLDHARNQMQNLKSSPSSRAFGDVVRDLVLLGQDQPAINLWKLSLQHDMAGPSSRFVLEALFRAQDRDNFILAWQQSGSSSLIAQDMLWALFTPRLSSPLDKTTVRLLASNLRPPSLWVDAQRLLPLAKSTLGVSAARSIFMQELNTLQPSDPNRQKLADLLSVFK